MMLDYDGDHRGDVSWFLSVCTTHVDDPFQPFPGIRVDRFETFAPQSGVQFWVSSDTNRVPFGTAIGAGDHPDLLPESRYAPITPGHTPVFAISVVDAGGGLRRGWMRTRADYTDELELEFSSDTNRPIELGLPAEPRWLPRVNPGPEQLSSPEPSAGLGGFLASFGSYPAAFNRGVTALTVSTNGTLHGIGLDEGVFSSSGSGLWTAHLFTMATDGSRFQVITNLGPGTAEIPECSVITTTQGRVVAHRVGGALIRWDPSAGTVTDLRKANPPLPRMKSPLQRLSDGNLYSTTEAVLVRLDPEADSGTTFAVGAPGLRNLNAGLAEGHDGWIYLVAQSGGAGNCGGILRCRRDGTEASEWMSFAALAGPPGSPRPDLGLLAAMTKSPPALARDGSLYGNMRQRLFNLTYRVAPDGAPGIVQFNRWNGGEQGQVTNDLGGFTWLGTFPRGVSGGFVEGADGHLYGVAQQEWNGDYPEFPAAIQRIRIPGGTLETLSQSSLLNRHFSYLEDGSFFQRMPAGVPGPDGVLYFGSFDGVMSYRPGWNGIRPLRRTGPAYSPKPRPQGPIMRGPAGHFLAVSPDDGALHEGTISLIGPDRPWHRVIHSFSGGAGDVLEPSGFLASGDLGWVYGTSQRGNAHEFSPKLWRVHDTTGAFEVLATLPGRHGDGADLPCGLMRGRDGRFYGTTPRGGVADLGTLFVFDARDGRLTVLHEFGTSASDRGQPWPQLTEATDGLLYGLLTGENLESAAPDRWFRIAPDGSRYAMLGILPRSPDSGLEIAGGLTQDSTGHFYCVRALSVSAPTNAPVMGQLFRLTPPGPNAEPGSADLVFENPSGAAPHVSPVGPLMPLPDGTLLGLSRSSRTVLYALDPVTRVVRMIHRPRMRGVPGSLEYADRFTAAVLESATSIVLPLHGAITRLDLTPPPVPQPIAELRFSGGYGDLFSHLYPQDVFRDAPYLTGASGLPEGIRYFGHAEGNPIGSIAGRFQTTGTFLAEAYTTDGQWPEAIVTNRITFEVAPRPLTLRGPVALWVTGEPKPLPESIVEGLLPEDAGRLSITWSLPDGAASRPGTHAIQPEIRDPDGRLNHYLVSVEPGRLTVVDRESRIVKDGDASFLEFPPLPAHHFSVWQAPSLRGPWSLVHQTPGRPGRTNRFRLDPSHEESARFFRVEATR